MKNIVREKGIFKAYTLRNSNFIIEQVKLINDKDDFIDTGNIDTIKIYYNVNNATQIFHLLDTGGELKIENTSKGLSKGEPDIYYYNKETGKFTIVCGGDRKQYECDIIIKQEFIKDIKYLLYSTHECYRNEIVNEKESGKSTERVQKYRQSIKLAKKREPILNLHPNAIEKFKDINYKSLSPTLSDQEIKNKLLRSDLFDEVIEACKNDERKKLL